MSKICMYALLLFCTRVDKPLTNHIYSFSVVIGTFLIWKMLFSISELNPFKEIMIHRNTIVNKILFFSVVYLIIIIIFNIPNILYGKYLTLEASAN